MKHTPGPWTVEPSRNKHFRYAVTFEDDDRATYIAGVGNKANARLIAVAPNLLKALEDIATVLSAPYTQADADPGPYIDLVGRANAAIAKAKGE